MNAALLLARRELRSLAVSVVGYVLVAAYLLGVGLWFYIRGLDGNKLSSEVLSTFFDASSFAIGGLSVLLGMKLVAGERENDTMVLLSTAPIREREIVAGKFLAGMAVITLVLALSVYMPLLVFVNGKVSVGHVVVGYVGMLQLAACTLAICLFASTLSNTQIVAAIIAALALVSAWLFFYLAKVADPPIKDFIAASSIYQRRWSPTMNGILKLENVVFNVFVAYAFLLAATKTLEARRWR